MIRDKIIIVEDDPGISKYLQAALRSHGYDILLAPDGKTALEMIASHCPDVLLLDLGLPDMDGSEIIRSVRTWSRMPIIIRTVWRILSRLWTSSKDIGIFP